MFRPHRIIESWASSDWLEFRVPLVTLVTCRRQVSSIYRTSKQQKIVLQKVRLAFNQENTETYMQNQTWKQT